jgi:hypothetical protein
LTVSSPKVVAEVIDGEAIILDLRAGTYFATEGVGAVVWTAAAAGWDTAEIASAAASFYSSHSGVQHEVVALLDAFVAAGLLVTTEANHGEQPEFDWPASYATPTLEKHDDLQDMMQLDPIHDTDASGWPMPAPKRN